MRVRIGSPYRPLIEIGRHDAPRKSANPVAPDRIFVLVGEIGMKLGAGDTGAPREHVADFGKELIPPLMREELPVRPSFHWSPLGNRIAMRINPRVPKDIEVMVVGDTLGVVVTQGARKDRVPKHALREWQRLLHDQAGHALTELLDAVEWTARRSGRHVGKGAACERTASRSCTKAGRQQRISPNARDRGD